MVFIYHHVRYMHACVLEFPPSCKLTSHRKANLAMQQEFLLSNKLIRGCVNKKYMRGVFVVL
jgi:hypothetical protein